MERKETNYQHTLVDDEKALVEVISEIKCGLKSKNIISVDCKGNNLAGLGRESNLAIFTIATLEHVYMFDVLKLKKTMFEKGLADILEDSSVQKLMFDCRQSSDCLWHTYGVRITGVLDLQLLEIMYRRDKYPTTTVFKHSRRSKNVNDVEKLQEYDECLTMYVKNEDLVESKESDFSRYITCVFPPWDRRPFTESMIKHCCVDAHGLFRLNENLSRNGKYHERLCVASARYADRYRFLEKRTYDDFERNEYLPLDIIPNEGVISFPSGNTPCVACHRYFPREEFSFTQLGKGVQKCRVCKKVKEWLDEEENRKRYEENSDIYEDDSEIDYYDIFSSFFKY